MNNVSLKLLFGFLFFLTMVSSSIAQEAQPYNLTYEINRSNPKYTLTKTQLNEADSLIDLNEYFKPEWAKQYVSVDVITSYKGAVVKTTSDNDQLSEAQKQAMAMADANRDIKVIYRYIPNSSHDDNDVRTDDFSFHVLPEQEAQYPEGIASMNKYLEEKAFNKISHSDIDIYNLAAVKFTVTEEGEIINSRVIESSKDESVDALLLEAICSMPSWKPAEYSNGKRISQDFVFTVGDHTSCTINVLNINRYNFK